MKIKLVGVELEGGWVRLPNGSNYSLHDDSSVLIDNDLEYIGEITSPPLPPSQIESWIGAHYPHQINRTCGLHVHISVSEDNYKICSRDRVFLTGLISELKNWGKNAGIDANHEFWKRLNGKNSYCKLEWRPNSQMLLKKKSEERYTAINFCKRLRGTIEFRILPMFSEHTLAISAVKCIINYVENFLKNNSYRSVINYEKTVRVESNYVKVIQREKGLEIQVHTPDLKWITRAFQIAYHREAWHEVARDEYRGHVAYYIDWSEPSDYRPWTDHLISSLESLEFDSENPLGQIPRKPSTWILWSPSATNRGARIIIDNLYLEPDEIDELAYAYYWDLETLVKANPQYWLDRLDEVNTRPIISAYSDRLPVQVGTAETIVSGKNWIKISQEANSVRITGHCPGIIDVIFKLITNKQQYSLIRGFAAPNATAVTPADHNRQQRLARLLEIDASQAEYSPNRLYVDPEKPALWPIWTWESYEGSLVVDFCGVNLSLGNWRRVVSGYRDALARLCKSEAYVTSRYFRRNKIQAIVCTKGIILNLNIKSHRLKQLREKMSVRGTARRTTIGDNTIYYVMSGDTYEREFEQYIDAQPGCLGYQPLWLWRFSPDEPYLWPIVTAAGNDGTTVIHFETLRTITPEQIEAILNSWMKTIENLEMTT